MGDMSSVSQGRIGFKQEVPVSSSRRGRFPFPPLARSEGRLLFPPPGAERRWVSPMSSGVGLCGLLGGVGVGEEGSVDDVGEFAFEGSGGFAFGVAVGGVSCDEVLSVG